MTGHARTRTYIALPPGRGGYGFVFGQGRPEQQDEAERKQRTVADKTAQTIHIDADPRTVMDVIADIASYPDWVSEYTEAEVLETDAAGNPKVARLVLDAAVLRDTMVLRYEWPADRASVRWSLVSSGLLKSLDGVYILTPKGSGTDVTYELAVDLMIPMIGLLKRKAERRLTDTALKDLKKRVEG